MSVANKNGFIIHWRNPCFQISIKRILTYKCFVWGGYLKYYFDLDMQQQKNQFQQPSLHASMLLPPTASRRFFFVYRFWNAVSSPGQAKTKDQIVIFIINFYFFCVEVFFKNQQIVELYVGLKKILNTRYCVWSRVLCSLQTIKKPPFL